MKNVLRYSCNKMALPFRVFIRNCVNSQVTKPVHRYVVRNFSQNIVKNEFHHKISSFDSTFTNIRRLEPLCISHRGCTTKNSEPNKPVPESEPPPKKLGLVQRFKQMYRDYWYVLLPVHVTTSAMWLGGLYYTVRSGVDVIALMESLGLSNRIIEPLKNSGAGYFALTFALYKIVAPLRYAVTIGGTTYAIKRLTNMGWIKPVPSTQRIKEMIQEKKEDLSDRFQESKIHYQGQMKEKRNQVMEEMKRYKMDMKNMKDKLKKM